MTAPSVSARTKYFCRTRKSTTTGTANTTTTGTTTQLSPVQQKLQRNTNLASKLQSRLPAGTNLNTAASGFRNLGQFVAAVNVSNNLGIPFTELKTRMVDRGMSLGQAIQDARPSTSGTTTTTAVHRAETDADDMIRTSSTTTTTSTTSGKTKSKKGHTTTGGN
ncbi:MAG TPA: hypothetical protein VN628_12280 [Vicinamibacterales bacterium]|nr:hypothetical protein [Vicinamibacterales bacterium]